MGTTASRMSTIFNAHLFFAKLPCKTAQHSSAADASGSCAISRAPQERTKVPDVFYGLEVEDFLNEIGALRRAEDRRDQVASFGGDFVAGHGIFRGAADIVDALLETGAIGECELHDGDAERHEALQFRIGDELHFGALAENCGIAHARSVVGSGKGDGVIEEHYRDHVLQADIGNLAIVDDGGFVGGELYVDLLHLRSVERMLLAQNFKSIEDSLNGRADGPALDVGARDFIALA